MRPIDADALWKQMEEYDDHMGSKGAHDLNVIHRDSILFAIEQAQTIDAVPVVRCKNCIACKKQDDYEYWCTAQSPAYLVAKDGFCSRGNRIKCSNVVCGYCQDGICYNDHEMRVIHVCPRGYGKEKDDER